jgi:hypothetical protein
LTAQVAVLNLAGIAIASDTYVTTFVDNEAKSMGNSQKIFELGPQHKVLVLHSSTISINQIPHSLHVAEWAKTLTLPLPTLQAYVDSYRTWSSSENRMFNSDSEGYLINSVLNEQYYDLARELDDAKAGVALEDGVTERKKKTAWQTAYKETIQNNMTYFEGLDAYVGLTERSAKKAISDREIDLEEKVEYIFKRFDLPESLMASLVELGVQTLLKIQPMRQDSELGFVGFGDEEPFGGVIRLTCRGLYAGVLVAAAKERWAVSPSQNPSGISYFAQRDAMWAFISGYNSDIIDEVKNQIIQKVEAAWGHTTEEAIGWKMAQEIESEIADFSQKTFVSPMLSTIEAMGMNSLAALADSLVGLQATATYSKAGPATVGGLIEVVTIDRINGVQWKRRLQSGWSKPE